MRMAMFRAPVALTVATLSSIGPGQAQTPAEFYRGKAISLEISSSVGGGYDSYGRLLARHMPKHTLIGELYATAPAVVAKTAEMIK
jgi:hypothetical protein